MLLSTLFMIILIEAFYQSLSTVNSTILPNVESMDFKDKFENLNQFLNKLDLSVQKLHENSQNWPIWQHHIESWNDGLRVMENKLDLLKRLQDEQQLQLEKIENMITTGTNRNSKTNLNILNHTLLLIDIKDLLSKQYKERNELSLKLNNIMHYLQVDDENIKLNKKKLNRTNKVTLPSKGVNCNCNNQSIIDIQKFVQQKEFKQLHSLGKRNAKSLESVVHSLADNAHHQEEILLLLQRSNDCCCSLTNELTTFTESSDILLKRIEKLLYNINLKKFDNEERQKTKDDNTREEEFLITAAGEADADADAGSGEEEYYKRSSDLEDVEFLRPLLKGCHQLLYEINNADEPLFIDGIYKFSSIDLNEADRDFNERYCVYSYENQTGWPWTLIQHRGPYKRQENFNRSWSDYRNGFGSLTRDFWFGNEFIHRLVYQNDYELRIELEDFNGTQTWAEYGIFHVDSEKYNYNLIISDYRGIAPDALKYHNEMDFSTYDRRNDKTIHACCPCALSYASGWWFDNCAETNLNGIYHHTPLHHNYIGIIWESWLGDYSLRETRMMIRPKQINLIYKKDP
uniref:Fibrinogen C-terminal domain-containing protein n=1 Tax=Glossina brevipalpis TaxID=37001 RepID=A0A1A9WFP4_9MUSC